MKKSWIKKLQIGFLLTAVILAGSAFLPAQSQASGPTSCSDVGCPDEGGFLCDVFEGPNGWVICRDEPIPCI